MEITRSLLKPDCEEFYRVSNQQYTVYPLRPSTKYEDILSDKGLEKFHAAQARYNSGDIKDTFISYRIIWDLSGMWIKDEDSKYVRWDHDDPSTNFEIKVICNDHSNACIYGNTFSNVDSLMTSCCIFITKKWCLTKSGSIYAFSPF